MRRTLPIFCVALFLVACDDGGTSEPIQYPKQSAIEILSSAESSSETASSMTESSLSEENSSSETLSNSSSSYAKSSSGELKSSSVVKSSSSIVAPPCKTETEDNCEYGTLVDDRDGQTYKTVKIGNQIWMAENLNYAYLQPTSTLDSSSWCYDNDPENCKKYGRLYLWSAAMDSAALFSDDGKKCGLEREFQCGTELCCEMCEIMDRQIRGVCPVGWRMPSEEDWLLVSDGFYASASSIKSDNGWNDDGNGTNSKGLNVLPAGIFSQRSVYGADVFAAIGVTAYFWTSVEMSCREAYYMFVESVSLTDCFPKSVGMSIRCLKDVILE